MKILWFTWKDRSHPLSGGAEVMNEEIAKRAVQDGHEVIFLVGGYPSCKTKEIIDGITYIRIGNRYTVYIRAMIYYLTYLRDWPDVVVEEINTMPFFTRLYVQRRRVLFIYQLARQVWFHEIALPLAWIGYLLEPIYLNILSNDPCFTESESTRTDLQKYGFRSELVYVIPPGTNITPAPSLGNVRKYDNFTVLSLGTIRSMKRTDHIVKAFEILKKTLPEARLLIAGYPYGSYGENVQKHIASSPFSSDIEFKGPVSPHEKKVLMQKSHVIAVTSIKEGWGLIITEANSQGTPAVVYNVDGLRDAVKDNVTGLITNKNAPTDLSNKILSLANDKNLYKKLQKNAYQWSKELTFDKSYEHFSRYLKQL